MCVSPNFIYQDTASGLVRTNVPCRRCWACLKNRVNDLVGRALCEGATSDYVWLLNLTYDNKRIVDRAQKETIVKKDFQDFLKRLRTFYKCRYLASGEFGERRGRAHFHCVIFGMGRPPRIALNKEFEYLLDAFGNELWPWGFTYAEEAGSERSIRYVAKYAVKQWTRKKSEAAADEWVTYSKQPLLGLQYIYEKARRQAEMRVFPQTFNYTPPGADTRNRYSFYGKAQEVFLDTLVAYWPEAMESPKTEWMENACRRYRKTKHLRRWDYLSRNYASHVQVWAYNQLMDFDPGLTERQVLRLQLQKMAEEDNEAVERWLKARAEIEHDQRRALSRHVLHTGHPGARPFS